MNIEHKIFEELVPSVLPLLKEHIKLGNAGIVDHSVDLSIPDLKKKYKKGMDSSNRVTSFPDGSLIPNEQFPWPRNWSLCD